MLKQLLFLCLIILGLECKSQDYFEGVVTFNKSFISLDDKYTSSNFEKMYGTWMIGFVKEDKYVVHLPIGTNDTMKVYYYLESSDGYLETTNSDTIQHFRIDELSGTLISAKISNETKIVLGDTCRSFNIDYLPKENYLEKVEAKYFYNSKYKLNPEYYKNHKESFWNLFVNETKSISVRNEITNYPLYKVVYEARSIIEKQLGDKYFILNKEKHINRKQ